jgi:bacteriocin resistance YdeI/OmpD-like protein/uncharacterized protein DUF1905
MVSTVTTKSFTVELERAAKTSARFAVPLDLERVYGRARPPLRVTIRGHTWRTTPGVYGGVAYVGLNKEVRAVVGVDAGDRLRVAIELDTEPRTVTVPDDLQAALADDRDARVALEKLSYTHRREYVAWIDEAKRPQTRARRAAGTIEGVLAGRHR